MRKFLFVAASVFMIGAVQAQKSSNEVKFELGKGLNISFNNGQNRINIGGYVQPNAVYEGFKGESGYDYNFGMKRAYLSIGGDFMNEKFSFLLQMNYVDSYPLLDAWIGYQPWKLLKVSVGQKQSFSGTRSMMLYDHALALGNRGLSDMTFFGSGREFGLFLESRIPVSDNVGLDLGVALTSGDGRNAFGSSSTFSNNDYGSPKYSGRATVYPLGFFAKGNELTGADFAHEKRVKIALGVAFSYQQTSYPNGEGYDEFVMYDAGGKQKFPGYQKLSADLMLKYRGFTFLAEMTNATGSGLNKLYTAPTPVSKLQQGQIADYLILGNGYNFQAGYLFKKKWALDLRYGYLTPEFKQNQTLITKTSAYTLGVAKYFIDNRLKVQLQGTYQDQPKLDSGAQRMIAELTAHIVF